MTRTAGDRRRQHRRKRSRQAPRAWPAPARGCPRLPPDSPRRARDGAAVVGRVRRSARGACGRHDRHLRRRPAPRASRARSRGVHDGRHVFDPASGAAARSARRAGSAHPDAAHVEPTARPMRASPRELLLSGCAQSTSRSSPDRGRGRGHAHRRRTPDTRARQPPLCAYCVRGWVIRIATGCRVAPVRARSPRRAT